MRSLKKTMLSTAEVARLFNVTETTVKRWADDGTLKCQKTPGGHRKFLMRHVAEFATDHNFEPIGTLALSVKDLAAPRVETAVLTRDYAALADVFVEKALSPDVTDLTLYFSYLYQHHLPLWEIYDRVLAPGMHEIGERWARGDIGVGHEHRASYEVLDALAKLQAQVRIKDRTGLSVVCACLDDELHEIGLRCAANLFESEGWGVHFLGARTPADALIAAVAELAPSVVLVSITTPAAADRQRESLRRVAEAARGQGAVTILGGSRAHQDLADAAGCIRAFPDVTGLKEFIHEFSQSRRGDAVSTR
jgi:excisionase family DNA binding protein